MQRFELLRVDNDTYSSTIMHTSRSKNTWSTYEWPIKPLPKKHTTKEWAIHNTREKQDFDWLLGKIEKQITNPAFVLGSSSKNFPSSRWLSIEEDTNKTVSEDNYHEFIYLDKINELKNAGVPIHIMITGNRSIHLHVFFESLINKSVLNKMAHAIGLCFVGGEYCTSNLIKCMRFPGFKHQGSTRNLPGFNNEDTEHMSRYIGTSGKQENLKCLLDNARYLENAEICKKDSATLNTNFPDIDVDVQAIAPQIKPQAQPSSIPKTNNSFVNDHVDKTLFERYIKHGIPKGQFRDSICLSKQFALWLTHSLNSKEKSCQELYRIARIDISNSATIKNRHEFIDGVLAKLNYIPHKGSLKKPLSKRDINMIDNAAKKAIDCRPRMDIEKARKTLIHFVQIIRSGKSGGVSIGEIATLIGLAKMNAKKYVDMFCVYGKTKNGKIIKNKAVVPMFIMKRESTAYKSRRWELLK